MAATLRLGAEQWESASHCTAASLLVVFALASGSADAQPHRTGWMPVSGDGARQVRLESLRTAKPLVSYVLRYVDSAGSQTSAPLGVEVDCAERERRELPGGKAMPPYTGQAKEEVEYVCRWAMSHWQAGRVTVDALDPSWWGGSRGQIAEAPPERPGLPESRAPQEAPKAIAPQPKKNERGVVTGSGFVVAPGRIVTNQHVVSSCEKLAVRQDSQTTRANVISAIEKMDLALLGTTTPVGSAVALRASAALGEEVTVAGYPLSGILSDDLIVTSGQVNSLAGLRNDPTILQISAPVQPGNSGGPLVDRSGSVVGVVVSKLNAERVAKVTGDIAQNVNFAIKPEVLRLFLDSHRVSYRSGGLGQRLDGIQLAERARGFTVQVICEQ